MLLCNPNAGLILSTGAGSEVQFSMAGFYQENGDQCYKRVANLYDLDEYSDAFYQAATEDLESRHANGTRLHDFIMANDIERWSAAFLDPSWTHQVIRPSEVFFRDASSTENFRSFCRKCHYIHLSFHKNEFGHFVAVGNEVLNDNP